MFKNYSNLIKATFEIKVKFSIHNINYEDISSARQTAGGGTNQLTDGSTETY